MTISTGSDPSPTN